MNSLKSALDFQIQVSPYLSTTEEFHSLLQKLSVAKFNSEETLEILNRFFASHRLLPSDFPVAKNAYTRSSLLKEKTGFEIMIARWEKGAVTPIHGHPYYSFMYVIEGQLNEQLFLLNQNKLMKVSTLNYGPGSFSYHKGVENTFDNAIHRIAAVKSSLSIHIYSDDALKGEVYKTT